MVRAEKSSFRYGRELPLEVRRNPRARYVSLRVDAASDHPVLILPRGVPLSEGLAFARAKRDWLALRYAALPPRVAFEDGALVPVEGQPHLVRHRSGLRGSVRRTLGTSGRILEVGGAEEHLPRRLADWLKAEARRLIARSVAEKSVAIDRWPSRITLRDTSSRWGSCSPAGRLSFSWRLVMAPSHVLDYVVAHEVAHLVHLNHGKSFWKLVEELARNQPGARNWLTQNGPALLRYGV
jgi:predicted metal-dependent hydrolase